jgi:hypothetical protein
MGHTRRNLDFSFHENQIMRHDEIMNLGIKWLVGVSSSAALSFEESMKEIALALSLLVSLLTIANLAWGLWDKIKKGRSSRE